MDKDKIDKLLGIYRWNGKFFLLTRDHTVEITETGEDDYNKKGTLFFYANQCAVRPKEEIDEFGRNYLDQMFIGLCVQLRCFICLPEPPKAFHSLTTLKDGDRHMVRVRYDDVDLEMEVVEAFNYFTEKLKEK